MDYKDFEFTIPTAVIEELKLVLGTHKSAATSVTIKGFRCPVEENKPNGYRWEVRYHDN